MDRITLQNYRCFGSEEQSARLAPLTLLVGPNSTGKTSFLALIRALWDVAFREVVPNFREHPYDLGSWDDIVYNAGGRGPSPDCFRGRFDEPHFLVPEDNVISYFAEFESWRTAPLPTVRTYGFNDFGIELRATEGQS